MSASPLGGHWREAAPHLPCGHRQGSGEQQGAVTCPGRRPGLWLASPFLSALRLLENICSVSLALRIGTPGGDVVGSTAPPVQAATLGEGAGRSEAQGRTDTEHCPWGDGTFPTGSGLASLLPPTRSLAQPRPSPRGPVQPRGQHGVPRSHPHSDTVVTPPQNLTQVA